MVFCLLFVIVVLFCQYQKLLRSAFMNNFMGISSHRSILLLEDRLCRFLGPKWQKLGPLVIRFEIMSKVSGVMMYRLRTASGYPQVMFQHVKSFHRNTPS